MNEIALHVLLAAGLFFLGLYGKSVRIKENKNNPEKRNRKTKKERKGDHE